MSGQKEKSFLEGETPTLKLQLTSLDVDSSEYAVINTKIHGPLNTVSTFLGKFFFDLLNSRSCQIQLPKLKRASMRSQVEL